MARGLTMRNWYSAAELAGLPDLPTTERRVRARAQREGWPSRPAMGKKGLQYPETALPPAAQAALVNRRTDAVLAAHAAAFEAETAPTPAVRDLQEQIAARRPTEEERLRHKAEGQAKFAALAKDHPKRRRAKAREWLVSAYQQLCREQPDLAKAAARALICARVNDGELVLPPAVAAEMPRYRQTCRLAEASLHRWIDRYATDGIWGLTDNYGTRAGQSLIDTQPLLQRLILGQMRRMRSLP